MRPRLFAIAANVLTLAGMPAAGGALLGLTSQPHRTGTSLAPPRVAISPPGARSPFTSITMTPAGVQWDMHIARRFDFGYRLTIDAIDVDGHHGTSNSGGCVRRTATLVHCTLAPAATPHAQWAAAILAFVYGDGRGPVTLTVHP